MHSFLLISKDEKIAQEKINILCTQHQVAPIDHAIISFEKAVGIEDIRVVQEKLSLAPLQGPTKALVIYKADTLTNPAQNALLKILEEPPNNTIIILVASTKTVFLPTVLSRCTLIEDSISLTELDKKEHEEYLKIFAACSQHTVSQQLFFSQEFGKTKESALHWLEKAIYVAREKLLETKNTQWVLIIRNMQKTHTLLSKTNTSPRLAMEHLFIDTF